VCRVGYDEEAVYVAFHCYDPDPERIAAAKTRRDSQLRYDDAVVIMFDTFDDDMTCSAFATNLLGTQQDYRVTDNGRSTDIKWDTEWQSAAARVPEGWTAEFAIPFKSLRFETGEGQTWGFNFGRFYPRRLERSFWAGPLERPRMVSRFGRLTGLNLQHRMKRYEIIPYGTAQMERGEKTQGKAGLDFRYKLTSSLSTDLTLNPDFALIEADAEFINLTRFEQFVSEKRPFFLEGQELFEQRLTQFYSRRIGDITWGSKLTGKIGLWDLAMITLQGQPTPVETGKTFEAGDATYTVLRGKRRIFSTSNIGFLVANRYINETNQGSVGLDTTLFLTDILNITAQFIRAHGPENDGRLAWFVRPSYDSASTHFHIRYQNLDNGLMENMNTMGFWPDDNRKEYDTNLGHTFWMRDHWIEKIRMAVNYNRYWSQAGILRSWDAEPELRIDLAGRWGFEINRHESFKRYEKDFRYGTTGFHATYDTRSGRSASVYYEFGRNEDRDVRLLGTGTSLKITDAWQASYRLKRLWLDPDPDNESTWIHILRTDYYFKKDLFLKLFFQTNSVIEKETTQVLLIWRYLPPFGALQLAYQKGTSRYGTSPDQDHTVFIKMSWVF